MRPIFCGNLDYDTRQSEVERLFRRYGRIDKIDMKSGFAFVYMEDDRDADDAIRALDRTEFGRKGRRLRIEWAKHEDRGGGGSRVGRGSRRSPGSMRPSKTLFVINFDPVSTRMRDLERHFEPYGKIVNIRIRRNFAFVQYDTLDDASKAFEATNGSKLLDRVLSVEYALRDDDERDGHQSPSRRDRNGDGGRDRSPNRDRYRARDRSPSPYGRGRERGSPDYGRGPSPRDNNGRAKSPQRGRSRSPVNGGRADSPIPERERERSRERVRDRSRERERDRERGRYREKSEEKVREKDLEKERDRERKRERSQEREREQDRERSEERGREKDREMSEERDRERGRDRFRSFPPFSSSSPFSTMTLVPSLLHFIGDGQKGCERTTEVITDGVGVRRRKHDAKRRRSRGRRGHDAKRRQSRRGDAATTRRGDEVGGAVQPRRE